MKHPLQQTLGFILAPFSFVYSIIMALRRKMLTTQREGGLFAEAPPIISVGNISWGGSGKSVVVDYLLALSASSLPKNSQAAVLTRGYGAKLPQYPCILLGESIKSVQKTAHGPEQDPWPEYMPKNLPDEPLMLALKHPQVPVVIDPKRRRGAEELLTDLRFQNISLLILDDAFQHIAMPRNVNLVLLSAEDFSAEYWNRVIPWGTWREGKGALFAASAFLIKASVEEWEVLEHAALEKLAPFNKPIFVFRFEVETCFAAATGKKKHVFSAEYILVSGVANPQSVEVSATKALGAPVQHIVFADHHVFTEEEANALAVYGLPVVCTEKDAVKLEQFSSLLPYLYVLPGKAVFFASYGAAPFDIWVQEQV